MKKGLALLVCGIWVYGCGGIVPPPLTPPFRPREVVAIENFKFRVAVLDFTDQTGQAGDLIKTIPDILTTELFKEGRLGLYERDPLRGLPPKDAGEVVQNLMDERKIDGVLSGTVTRFSRVDKIIVVDVRLLSRNKAVMFADQHTLGYVGRRSMVISRNDVDSLGEAISRAVPRVPNMKIVSKNSAIVSLSGGSNFGLVAGMTGYVQAYLDKVNDPETGEIPKPTPVIVGEVVVDQVSGDSAMGRIVAGEDIHVNDTLRFK